MSGVLNVAITSHHADRCKGCDLALAGALRIAYMPVSSSIAMTAGGSRVREAVPTECQITRGIIVPTVEGSNGMDEVTAIRAALDKIEADSEAIRMAVQVSPIEAQEMLRRLVLELRNVKNALAQYEMFNDIC